jgi:hypothetical protein
MTELIDTIPKLRVVFDVESVGLYGEAFAVGWVVIDSAGCEIESGILSCPLEQAKGADQDRDWVKTHVVPALPKPNCADPFGIRCLFWSKIQLWKSQGAEFWADCGYPVEANFLIACVLDDRENRVWNAPYPLHEIASVLTLAGRDPLGVYDRLPSELPAHNPLCDSRQSARLMHESKTTVATKAL